MLHRLQVETDKLKEDMVPPLEVDKDDSVSCGPRSSGHVQEGVSILTRLTSSDFTYS